MRYLLIGLFLVAATANAEDWQPIGKLDSNGGVLLLDVAGITQVQGFRRAWIKAVYTSDQPVPTEYLGSVPKDFRSYRSERTLRYFNCPERTGAVMRYFWKIGDDEPGAYFYQDPLIFRPVPSGTLDEQMLQAVCNFAGEFADAKTAGLHLPGEEARKAKITRMGRPGDYYPAGSRSRQEQGAPLVQACVGPTGALLRAPIVTETSGFSDLDNAAITVAKATRYAAGTENGAALPESCITFKVKFTINKR
jgi:TonB family protein